MTYTADRRTGLSSLMPAVVVAQLLALAIALHGCKFGVYAWAFSSRLSDLFALWSLRCFNYEQQTGRVVLGWLRGLTVAPAPTMSFGSPGLLVCYMPEARCFAE